MYDSSNLCLLAWNDQDLYLAWDVRDKTQWINGAEQPEDLYLRGDTVDFQLGSDFFRGWRWGGPEWRS